MAGSPFGPGKPRAGAGGTSNRGPAGGASGGGTGATSTTGSGNAAGTTGPGSGIRFRSRSPLARAAAVPCRNPAYQSSVRAIPASVRYLVRRYLNGGRYGGSPLP